MPLARLNPHSPRDGYPRGSFGYRGKIFRAGHPALQVTEEEAKFLETVREHDSNPNSPLAFQVWAPEQDEPEPTPLVFVGDEKKTAITAADLRGEFIPRSEMTEIVAREVAKALRAAEEAYREAGVSRSSGKTPAAAVSPPVGAASQSTAVNSALPIAEPVLPPDAVQATPDSNVPSPPSPETHESWSGTAGEEELKKNAAANAAKLEGMFRKDKRK